jgi:hypothetical protein
VASKNSKENARVLAKGGSLAEPIIDVNNYNRTLSEALMYYNNEFTLADYKESALEYAVTLGITISRGIAEYHFRGIGAVCRLILRGCSIRLDDINRTIEKLHIIQSEYEKNKVSEVIPKEVVKVESNVVHLDQSVLDYKNLIEDEMIQNILDGNTVAVDKFVSQYANSNFNKIQAKSIDTFVSYLLSNYNKAYADKRGSDSDLIEAWSHIPLSRIKTAIKALETLLTDISTVKTKEKVAKVLTKRKDLSPLIQTKDMPYLKSYDKIDGIHPQLAIHCSEIWVYDTETRDIHVIRAMKDLKLSAKGHTFMNVDDTKSYKKKLRKPEEQLYSIIGLLETPTKKSMNLSFNEIKTTQQATSGRMNEFKIIIQVFK